MNLSTLQQFVDNGRLDASQPINMRTLVRSGAVGRRTRDGVKLLATGKDYFTAKVDIEVSRASQEAIETVERLGGKVVCAYYNKLGLRVLLKPEKFEGREIPRRALPTKKLMPYYLDPKNRGYLLTEAGQERLAQGGMKGAYLDSNGRVAIPGKRTTLYSPPAPTKEEAELEQMSKSENDESSLTST